MPRVTGLTILPAAVGKLALAKFENVKVKVKNAKNMYSLPIM